MDVAIQDTLEVSDCRELGKDKSIWTLSTAKPGNGIEQLRDGNLETYWQSDGPQPHYINIQFLRRTTVSKIAFYVDYNLDESYTPKKISIKCGESMHDLVDLTTIELHEPIGWVSVALSIPEEIGESLRTHIIQVQVHTMHQNGRDTHLRQVKVFGPRSYPVVMGNLSMSKFQSLEMLQCSILR